MRFDGKQVLVTGAGNGIGRATAIEFAREGARVACVDIDLAAANRVAEEIAGNGLVARAYEADVTDAKAIDKLFEQVGSLQSLDVVVNCAGILDGTGALEETELHSLRRTMAVNLEGVFLCMRAAIALMKRQGHGAIVNVASQAAHEAMPGLAAYTASKHAVWGLTKVAALECARDNIQINAVSPGVVNTDLTRRAFAGKPEMEQALIESLPTGRYLQPEEVARSILFLASADAAQFIGQSLRLDGGGADVKPSTLWHYPQPAPGLAA